MHSENKVSAPRKVNILNAKQDYSAHTTWKCGHDQEWQEIGKQVPAESNCIPP